MQEHRYSFEIDASPEEIWAVMHTRPDHPDGFVGMGEFGPFVRKIEHGPVTIEILHEGDEHGQGLVRHCFFRVPKYLLSGGMAQSWEHVTEVVPNVSAKYYAIGKPLWSRATGWTRLTDLGDNRTRVTFIEEYEAFNPVMRVLFEKRVHEGLSRDNDTILAALNGGLKWHRRRQEKLEKEAKA